MPTTARLAERHSGNKAEGGLERVTINLTPRAFRALELATELTGDSKTDVINRAVQVYAYLEHIIASGGSIHAQDSEGSKTELLFF
jgi:hypothetical protein